MAAWIVVCSVVRAATLSWNAFPPFGRRTLPNRRRCGWLASLAFLGFIAEANAAASLAAATTTRRPSPGDTTPDSLALAPYRKAQQRIRGFLGERRAAAAESLMIDLAEESLRIKQRELGADHLETPSQYKLANLLTLGPGRAPARALYEACLATRENQLGPDHPYIAQVLNALAVHIRDLGDYAGR